MSIWAINVTLVHEGKSYPVLLVDCFFDLLIWVWFLVIELIAWESDYLKPTSGVFIVHLNQSEIVFLSEGSV